MVRRQDSKQKKPAGHKEGKIGSGYMSTLEGQPALKDTVELTAKKDFEIRPRETKQ